jgi:hypothetical protein
MLYRQVFIATHVGAGGSMLMDMLLALPKMGRLRRLDTQVYSDPSALASLQDEARHFRPHAKAFLDKLTHNYELADKNFYRLANYIILVREPEDSLNWIVQDGYSEAGALRYYCYRLRRLCEIAKKADRWIAVTWNELVDKTALPRIKSFMGLRELPSVYKPQETKRTVAPATVLTARKAYDKYLNYLRRLESQKSNR